MISGFKKGNRYRLGDQLTVKVEKVDLQDRQLYLEVVKNHSAGRGEKAGRQEDQVNQIEIQIQTQERPSRQKEKEEKAVGAW